MRLLLASLILLVASLVAAQNPTKDLTQSIQQADAAEKQNKFDDALRHFHTGHGLRRLTWVTGRQGRHPRAPTVAAAGVGAPVPAGRRRAWFDGIWHDTPVYRREQLGVGAALTGPAIVEQLDTTTVIEPGDRVRVDALGNLEIAVSALRA